MTMTEVDGTIDNNLLYKYAKYADEYVKALLV